MNQSRSWRVRRQGASAKVNSPYRPCRAVDKRSLLWGLIVAFPVSAFVARAKAVASAGLVMTPATFSVLNPSIFGDYGAVVLGGSYGQRPVAKTYLFSASLSHVRFQFGRTTSPYSTYGRKVFMTSLDYARGIPSQAINPSL